MKIEPPRGLQKVLVSKQYYIVRHGLTALPGVVLGQCDPALSEEGRRQAVELAALLRSETEAAPVERIVSSTLLRAHETATLVAETVGLALETDSRLNEISYGCWDGLTWDEIEQRDPETAARKATDWWSVAPQDGESAADFLARVAAAWDALKAHPARTTVVVAHAAVNAMLVELAGRAPDGEQEARPRWERVSSFEQKPGAYFKVTVA